MAELNFGRSLASYERFYNIAHIAAAAVCVLMGIFAIFTKNGYIYFPPIFIVNAIIQIINAYDVLKDVRRNSKSKKLGISMLVFAAILAFLSFVSIKCFWV